MRPIRKELSPKVLLMRGVPKHLHDASFKDLDSFGSEARQTIIDYIVDYIKTIPTQFDNNNGLFIFGSNGTGKSFIASLIVKYAYIFRYTSKRCTLMDYINEYTRMWGCKNAEEREALEELFYRNFKAVEFLCIEEIGKEIDTKVSINILEDLLRYREENGLVTIICTNLEPKILAEKYGNSINSLLKGNCTPIKLVGSDNRLNTFKRRVED